MCCTKYGSQNATKSGFVKGQQRYRCKDCCYQFIPTIMEKVNRKK